MLGVYAALQPGAGHDGRSGLAKRADAASRVASHDVV